MSPIREGGKSAPSFSLVPPLDCQDVSQHQATDTPAVWDANPPLDWKRSIPIIAIFAYLCLGIYVPQPVQLGMAFGAAFVGCYFAFRVTR